MSIDWTEKLRYVFPYARSIQVLAGEDPDGQWLVELVLPCRNGETRVWLHRMPVDEEHPRHEGLMQFNHAGAVARTEDGAVVPRHRTGPSARAGGSSSRPGTGWPRMTRSARWSRIGCDGTRSSPDPGRQRAF